MSKKNILVVDDDEDLLNIFKELLEEEEYRVTIASTSKEALEKVKKTRFHLAILDIVLPDIQGDRLAREIKKMDEAIQIIFITGYPEFQSCIESIDIGIAEILLKPLNRNELLTATENALLTSEEGTPIYQSGYSRILSTLKKGFRFFVTVFQFRRHISLLSL